jgi:hypothetical protein
MSLRWIGCALLVVLTGCQPAETRLDFKAEPLPNDRVKVVGDTSLPDGAQLNVSLKRPEEEDPLVVDLPVVKGAHFEALLNPKTHLAPGTYTVMVEFSPKAFAWSDQVKPAVGENGEKLGGPWVKDSGEGWKYLSIERAVRLP